MFMRRLVYARWKSSLPFIYLICILFTIDAYLFHMYMQGHATITMDMDYNHAATI